MQFPCASCARTYEIADELVVGRAVKVACPACGHLAVHRVPAAPPAPPEAPPPDTARSALAEASDDDFDSVLAGLDRPAAPPGPPAAAPPERAMAPPAEPPAAGPTPPVPAPRPPEPSLEDEEPVMVTAELVLRRSARRSRIVAAAVAAGVVVALVGGGAAALMFKRDATGLPGRGASRKGASSGASEVGAAAALSEADLAKLTGRKPEAQPPATAPAPAAGPAFEPAPQAAREKLSAKDRAMLDLIAKKGDAEVAVSDEDRVALSTSKASIDQRAIEATIAANAGAINACVNRALQADPGLNVAGRRIHLQLTLRSNGRVEKAAVAEPRFSKTPLGQCIAQAATRMVFPGFVGKPIDVTAPVVLNVAY